MNFKLLQEFYTVKEIMKLLKLSRLTIYRYIEAKKLKTYKFWLEHRIKKEDLEQFLDQSKK